MRPVDFLDVFLSGMQGILSVAQLVEMLQVQADLKIDSPGLCRALFEVYTGSNTVVPEAKKAWAEGARQLLDSEEVRRSTRRAGGG